MTVDIFKAVPQKNGTWASFNNVGDKYQGTYVDRINGEKDKWNNLQDIFVLKKEDGTLINVAVKHSKTGLMEQCNNLKFGQIVGFIFSGLGKPGQNGGQPTKFINVVQDPNIVDEEWLSSQKAVAEVPQASLTLETPTQPETPTVVRETIMTDTEKVQKIALLAKEKLGATEASQVKDKVMEATALAFIPSNLDAIITKLETM